MCVEIDVLYVFYMLLFFKEKMIFKVFNLISK